MKHLLTPALTLLLSTVIFLLLSCHTKATIQKVSNSENKVGNKTSVVSQSDTVILSAINPLRLSSEKDVNYFILVRHAEKSSRKDNPTLAPQGVDRADRLASILSDIELNKIYSTNYNRTIQTATPTATKQEITISNYGGFDHTDVIQDVLENAGSGITLIVGHSNTTANFINALLGTSDFPNLSEDAYADIFVVSKKLNGESKISRYKY